MKPKLKSLSQLIAIALSALFLAAGCAKPINTVERANPTAMPTNVDSQKLVTDTKLANKIMLESVNETIVSGDLVKIQANLRNLSKRGITVFYKFDWYDADGMAVATPTSAWKSRTIHGGELFSISAVAPNPRAADFRLNLRRD